jgi:uncharacterized protein (DUF2267 family)
VSAGEGVVGALRARLGSDARPESLVMAVVSALRRSLERDTFEAVIEELPWSLRAALHAPEQLPAVRHVDGKDSFIAAVAELTQRTPAQATFHVRAVFATLRAHLARGIVDAIERELPPDIADLWRSAR